MIRRFTLDGSPGLEQHLSRIGHEVRSGVGAIVPESALEGILLGGGYGRGEGGVLTTPLGDHPYNDLEFYVFVRGSSWVNEARFGSALHKLAEKLARQAGIEVELKISSIARLRKEPVTMFSYDLVAGHRQFHGPEDLLEGCEHHFAADKIPLSEATRLLMNRCSGLLFATEQLQRRPFTRACADFVRRNLAKAQLGFGDALLAASGEYHWSCRERHERLKRLEAALDPALLAAVRQHHLEGVEFKLRPHITRDPVETLSGLHSELARIGLQLWLWIENKRLRKNFGSAREYAFSTVNKCPEKALSRNLLVNFRRLGPSALLDFRSARYPRERLFCALALLLWEPATLAESNLLRKAQRSLRTLATTFPDLVSAYASLWRHFN
jgi:hypothetical protein